MSTATEADSSRISFVVDYQPDPSQTHSEVLHHELVRFPLSEFDFIPLHQIESVDQPAPSSLTRLTDLSIDPGIYELRSYSRSCVDPSCSTLETPSRGCAVRIMVPDSTSVSVLVAGRQGGACTIAVDGAETEDPMSGMELTLETVGAPGCTPVSPTDAVNETLATADGPTVVWGLLWEPIPFEVGEQIKMVFAIDGTGDAFDFVAVHDSGSEVRPDWGPHMSLPYTGAYGGRPGQGVGMAFTFPMPGCWDIQLTRGSSAAHVFVLVKEPEV